MKTNKIFAILATSLCVATTSLAETNTYYFMDEIPMRSSMNPAFMPNTQFYLDFVFLPNLSLSVGNNSFALKDAIFEHDGQIVTALHPSQNVDDLYKRIKRTTSFDMDLNINILEFGFRFRERNYLTFGLGVNVDGGLFLPRDLFKLALYGTPDEYGINSFNFKRTGLNLTAYGEFGVGYMRRINEQWTVGGKLSLLMGYAGATSKVRNLKLDASRDAWDVTAYADIYASMPLTFGTKDDGTVDFASASPYEDSMDYVKMLYKPAGHGASLDVGFTYEPIKYLVISGAITDLGFIYWHDNIIGGQLDGTYHFTGITWEPGDSVNLQKIGQDALDAFQFQSVQNQKGFAQMMHGNFNAAIEYGILKNKISFGLLSHMRFNAQRVTEEVTLAANFRPLDWLKAYLTYSFVNSRWNNIGLGLNLRVGMFNMFLAMDYIPLNWAKMTVAEGGNAIPIPYGTQRVNVQMGMNWNIGRDSSDKDRDGVKNRDDQCPGTPIKQLRKLCPDVNRKHFVDSIGCLLDEDQDGVPDCYDQCPGTPFGWPVDSVGCPFDDDKDGVYNYADSCPNTPIGVLVDSKGCPLDEDQDGVPDYLDKCPDTPIGVQVDENGCPTDQDGDGVPDHLDKCPDTPQGVRVDDDGCPIDSDGDGVPDYLDKCPNTPAGVQVNIDGCPTDQDGDGVPDHLDKCPNTPAEAFTTIDENGCPKDTDGDGVPDYLDKCPTTAGTVDNQGCPELKREVRNLFKRAMQGIQFETGKDVILPKSFPILNDIAKVMFENPTFNLTINGHTDNVGDDNSNMTLSEKRAASVRRYLIGQGIDERRLTANGFGETMPIADNKTKAGRAQNRRVEFLVTYEEITYEKVENPELQNNSTTPAMPADNQQ
ncbi:MAG: DUF5723 family protein [Bacteroidales bacterium]|nr:DUF5723 family protein [Bacteroidales bacterium]